MSRPSRDAAAVPPPPPPPPARDAPYGAVQAYWRKARTAKPRAGALDAGYLGDLIDFSAGRTSPAASPSPSSMQDFCRRNLYLVGKETDGVESDVERSRHEAKYRRRYRAGPVYGIRSHPGFLYMPGALFLSPPPSVGAVDAGEGPGGHEEGLAPRFRAPPPSLPPAGLEIARRALREWNERPHRTNLDASRPADAVSAGGGGTETGRGSLWESWLRGERRSARQEKSRKKSRTAPAPAERGRAAALLSKKLSWATLGYHYDWTRRAYRAGFRSALPPYLADLAAPFAQCSLWHDGGGDAPERVFRAEAAIVNYYGGKCTRMGGHRDDLELALEAPVVSASLGCPAVFLLGGEGGSDGNDGDGKRKRDADGDDLPPKVLPILVRSGDVMVLGGKSRLRLHGVAKILMGEEAAAVGVRLVEEGDRRSDGKYAPKFGAGTERRSLSDHDDEQSTEEEDLVYVRRFLSNHRININIRQVLPTGEVDFPPASVAD